MNTRSDDTRRTSRRRRLLIDRPLQERIVKSVLWPPALCLGATAALLSMFCYRLGVEAIEADIELSSMVPLLTTVVAFLLFSLWFLFFCALKVSHRVAGPLYRIRATLDAVKGGERGARARIRDGDYITEFADSINDFLEWVDREQSSGPRPTCASEPAETATSESARSP